MGASESRWELHARSGRAVLVGATEREPDEVDPARLELPDTLVEALHEWAHVVDTVTRNAPSTSDSHVQLVSQRGRQLAIRLAVETGGEVGYLDPLSGKVNRVGSQHTTRAAEAARRREARRRGGPQPPTPWATGLTVSAIICAIVVIALVVVTLGLAEVNFFLALIVNLAVAAGLAPSLWLGRRVLVWRWVAYGTAGGIVLAWIALMLSGLG